MELLTPPQNENLDSKIRHLQASELKFYDVRRAQIFNISNICWGLFEKMRFWPILGLFLILGHFRAVFGPFFGGFQIFWSLNIIGGDHRPILFFIVFHFWAILGHFRQFWDIFHFGAFLHFRVVRGARGGVTGVRGGL